MSSKSEYALEFLINAHSGPKCAWCKHPNKEIYRKSLCSSCYRISRKVKQLTALAEEYRKQDEPAPLGLEFDRDTYAVVAKYAQREGKSYDNIQEREITGLQLEWELSHVSKWFVKTDLFYGLASVLEHSFTADQRRLFFYLLSLMSRAHLRRGYKQRAAYSDERRRLSHGEPSDEQHPLPESRVHRASQ